MRNLCRARSDVRGRAEFLSRKTSRLSGEMNKRNQTDEIRTPLASAVELSTEAVVLTDSRGFIRYVNSAFEHITGYTREEVVGRSPHILDSGRHDEAFYQSMREILSRDGVWRGQLVSRKKDGTLYHEDCTVALIKGDDINSFVSIRRDIMDKMRLEAIAEKVDVENNNGFIFTGVRHEIGNVINSLLMLLGVLRTKLDSIEKPAVGEYLDRALEQAMKGSFLLRSLKNADLYEKPELQNIRLSAFMDKFVELVKEDCTVKGISITANRADGAEYCFADPRLLHQILLNLVINASDALEGREHRKIVLAVFEEENRIVIRVEDNGCGMSEEQVKNLFRPFHTTKAQGTGLGLVIVKKLLAAIKGAIKVSSLRNIGTTVDITIPGRNRECKETDKLLASA
jgi:PAS domain S-box-containing protein